MKMLYLSCHSVLEHSEVSLFHSLGYEIFSPGAYLEPQNPGDPTMRPGIPGLTYNPEIIEQWHRLAAQHSGEDTKDYLTKEFVDLFDAVVVMHLPRWIIRNWEVMKHKRVIWRTIGQSISSTETQLRPYRNAGMEIVRYSPREVTIPGYLGQNALIRFYKDPDEYKDWNGKTLQVVNFTQSMKQRAMACGWDIFNKVTEGFPRRLFGSRSEEEAFGGGKISFEKLKEEMRNARCYFYTGTHPASYTLNFIEAAQTGTPIVAIGPSHGNASYFPGHNLYEIPDFIENFVNGFISDDITELRNYIKLLLTNDDVAHQISEEGRKMAIKHFGKQTIKQQWKDYLGD